MLRTSVTGHDYIRSLQLNCAQSQQTELYLLALNASDRIMDLKALVLLTLLHSYTHPDQRHLISQQDVISLILARITVSCN